VLSALPTEEKPLTEKGSILGTFQYMAPEQLEGKDADARTDIFAFGAVLYEMVTGRKAFEGKSQASLISAIMKDEPQAISKLQPMTPSALEWTVRKCLAKDPENRWQSAKDLHDETKWIAEGGSATGVSEPVVAAPPGLWKLVLTAGLAVLLTAILMGIAFWRLMPQGPRAVTRFAITLPETDRLVAGGIALSADGRELVYPVIRDGIRQLYRRSMDQLEAFPIRGTEGAEYPFFSPDGGWVGFFADGKLKKVSLAGEPAMTLCDAGAPLGASWESDDNIIFASRTDLMQVRASGGAPRPITTPDTDRGELSHRWPDILPGGKAVLLTAWYGQRETARIEVQSLETEERKMLVEGTNPRYVSTGQIVFARELSLWAVPFDAGRLELTGSPTPLLEGIQVNTGGLALFALAGDGSLIYSPMSNIGDKTLVWVDRKGAVEATSAPPGPYRAPRLSPDGERLAWGMLPGIDVRDVWIYDLLRGASIRLTFGDGSNVRPLWSPGGERIFFVSNRGDNWDIFSKPVDGSGEVDQVTMGAYRVPTSLSSDGKTLVFRQVSSGERFDIGTVRIEGGGEPEILLGTPFNEHTGMLSPDDNWLAYVSDESGRDEVYVRPFPGPDGRVQVSTAGGRSPMWSRDGRELFYRNGDKMMAVTVSTDPNFATGKPTLLFEKQFESDPNHSNYDVAADGRFIMIQAGEQQAATQLNVVLNWFEELKRLFPVEN
jgi:serine/threonine-protein kinase